MKPHRWTAYIVLVVLMQVNKRREVSPCGQLQTTLEPILTNSYETHHWPWHVAIYHRFNESHCTYKCGGTLISSELILTAAHCVIVESEHISVSLGRLTLDKYLSNAQLTKVAEAIKHPHYDWNDQDNDIAIIKLSTSAKLNNYVQPVCLWKASKADISEVEGKSGIVIGWGLTEMGELSQKLRQASLPVIDPYKCLKSNRGLYGGVLSNTSYCAGNQNGTSVCSGDSGGSMTFEENEIYYIRGIVSVSPSKKIHETQKTVCDPSQYAVFTDVAKHLTWITKTKSTMECPEEVQCDWSVAKTCSVVLSVANFSQRCRKVIFDKSNTFVKFLLINKGQSDGIPDLSDAVGKFKNLESLRLEKLRIKIVDRVRLTAFRKIKFLSLSLNEITQLDADTFNELGNLTDLSIYSNELKNLHCDLFKELSCLETLRLDNNTLETLPASIFRNNKNIRRLYLGKNQLTELDAKIFKELGNLKVLYIEANNLAEIPTEIFKELYNLVLLNLHSNKIRTLPAAIFSNNKELQGLDLSNNQLTVIDVNIFKELTNLKYLLLRENKLNILPAAIFRYSPKLVSIDLSKNRVAIVDVDLFNELNNLEILHLNENKLEVLPAGLFNDNMKLKKIYLEFNKLRKIETNFYHLTQPSKLNFRGNVCIDADCGIAEDCAISTLHSLLENMKRNC